MSKGDFKKARGVLPPGALALHRAASGKVDCPIHGKGNIEMICLKCEATAAEQLAELQDLYDVVLKDFEAEFSIRKTLQQQLADKERELEDSRNEIVNINAQAQDIDCDISRLKQELTAANAVVEIGREIIKHSQTFGGNPHCIAPWQVKRARTDYGLLLDKLSAELDKLQGNDGDE